MLQHGLQRMKTRVTTLLGFVLSSACLCIPSPSVAESLKDVLESDPYRKVAGDAETVTRKKINSALKNSSPVTNYETIWLSTKPGSILLDWIGIRNTGGKLGIASVAMRPEYASALITIANREGVRVDVTIQVPKPEYYTMAEYRTLGSFNKFRPPALDVVADQVVPFDGIEATYYRHQGGACSLLFHIAKQGIVNLYTKRCSDSSVMMKYAKTLNFDRLNSKLNS
jgi:hypothetical protein